MNFANLFGYVMCLAGFVLMGWFSFQVEKLVTNFSASTAAMFLVGAVLILVGYLMTTVRGNDE